jgi:hypothetical protein
MEKPVLPRLKRTITNPAWISFTWFGITAGVSLLATPVKFSAPLATRAIALDIGRVTFSALNKVELMLLIVMLIIVRASGRSRHWWAICAALALVVILQSAWLLPELAARAQLVASGIEPPASYLHAAYSSLELCKLSLLLFAGFAALVEGTR